MLFVCSPLFGMQQIQWRSVDVRPNSFKSKMQNTNAWDKTQNRKTDVFSGLQIFGSLCELNLELHNILIELVYSATSRLYCYIET